MAKGATNLLLLLFCAAAVIPIVLCRRQGRHSNHRPNIILLMTDDQDVVLGSMEFMPKTLRLFRQRGVEFANGFVTTPICCPSRSSILTGLYVHNHNILTNNDNCTGPQWRSDHEPHTFGAYLQRSGYRTGYFGKYLNEYDGSYIPPGWDEWMGLIKNSRFYNYTVNYNGKKLKHGADYAKDYFTDLIANDSLAFFQRQRHLYPDKPVLMVLSFPAPHGPEDPAPHHADLFADVETHRTDSWNYAPNPDKQWLLQHTGKMEPVHVVFTDLLHRRRLQTLQSVDDNVQKVVNELREMRELADTYLIYTSDHGYHLGQFGLIKGKNMPYEFDIKVPFFVRGPGVARGKRVESPVANIDIAPSILAMAGLPTPSTMDGRSFVPLLQENERIVNQTVWRNTVLVERGKMPKLDRLRERLLQQRDSFSKEIRIEIECKKPEYQSPCKEQQRWECRRNEIGRWRIFKCRAQLEVENDCSCRRRRNRRHHRTTSAPTSKYDYQLKRVVSLDDLEREYNSSLPVPDSILNQWQRDFLSFLQWNDIVNSGQWYQGEFDDLDNFHSFTAVRSKRSTRAKKRKQAEVDDEDLDGVSVNALCVHFNTSVMCEPEVYKNPKAWERQKSKVDGRIQNLRRRLSAYKDIRKHLRQGRPLRDASSDNDEDEYEDVEVEDSDANGADQKNCRCGSPRLSHPLQAPMEISAADLLAYQTERQNARRNRPGKGKKKNGRGKKPPLPGSKRWLRVDTKQHCNVPQMSCFTHNPQHWRTPPLWPDAFGEFCFCQNSNNNTYWCLRTVNATMNTLYCEFVTGFVSYYDLAKDPDQLTNAVYTVSLPILEQMSDQLAKLKACKGTEECNHYSGPNWDKPFHLGRSESNG